ncbi:hypothetical protein G7054_g6784 [Neopestalotiopsis clavispora]|nr:hypothetical protein G7054_g6784 [Neopestalotiopsis clavispora]
MRNIGLLPQLVNKSSMTESLGRSSIELKAVLEAYHHDHDDDESTSSDGSANSLEDNVQEMTKDLQTDTLCLMELGDLLKDPILDSIQEIEKLAQHEAFFTWEPHQAFCDKVETRFPGVEEPLVLRLGKANYERYIRCQKERETQEQTVSIEGPDNPALQVVLDGSMFHDSGLGSSMPSTAPYAETLMSYGSAHGISVQVPALPAEGKAGKPFACFVCGKTVNITNNSAWKRHLYSDLQPWLCLDLSCSCGNAVFKDRDDWTSHLALDHRMDPRWESFKCPLCHAETGTGKATITRHLGAHLEEISLGALPINFDCESDSESTLSQPSPQLQPQTPQDAASLTSLRFTKYMFPRPGEPEGVFQPLEPSFQLHTNIFKQSYFNIAHFNNPDFQPEQWKPDEEDIPLTRIAGRKKGGFSI